MFSKTSTNLKLILIHYILDPFPPRIETYVETVEISEPLPTQIFCNVTGIPKPIIKWLKVKKFKNILMFYSNYIHAIFRIQKHLINPILRHQEINDF